MTDAHKLLLKGVKEEEEKKDIISDPMFYLNNKKNLISLAKENLKSKNKQKIKNIFDINEETEKSPKKRVKSAKNKFRGTKGDWLIIYFHVDGNNDGYENDSGDGNVILENTLEDEGKFETWKIVVIVVAIVLVIGLAIGCYCYRRKKQLAMMNQNAGGGYPGQTVGVNQYNNNAQYNPQYDPNQQYMQPGSNYDVNQQYNQPPANYDPNQQYNQPVDNYGRRFNQMPMC